MGRFDAFEEFWVKRDAGRFAEPAGDPFGLSEGALVPFASMKRDRNNVVPFLGG